MTTRRSRVALLLLTLSSPAAAGQPPPAAPRFQVVSKDGGSKVSLHLATQTRWQTDWKGPDHEADSQALFRRIRPTVKGNLLSADTAWLLHLSTAPGSLELMDLWVDHTLHPQARTRVGVQKVPFTRHRLNSFKDRVVADWSYPTRYFGAERQVGAVLHNGMGKPPELEYQLGVFSGRNSRASNAVGLPKLFGETVENPSSLLGAPGEERMHPEVVVHLARSTGGMNVRRPSDLEGRPLRTSFGVSVAWDSDPDPLHDLRLRVAPEAELKACGFALGAAGYLGLFDGELDADTYSPALAGWLLRASWVLSPGWEVAARWAEVRMLESLREELVARLGAGADPLHSERELTLGVNAYLLGTILKAQIDGSLLQHARGESNTQDGRVRLQLQMGF